MNRLAFLLVVFSLSASVNANAQEQNALHAPDKEDFSDVKPAPTLWVNFGGSFSDLTSHDNNANSSIRSAITGGIEAEIPVSRHFSIQTGIDYVQKGASIDAFDGFTGGKLVINYFELPVMARFNLQAGVNYFSFFAGPYLAIAVSRSEEDNNGETFDGTRAIKQWDTGIRLGAAFAMPITNFLTASINLQNDFGVLDINSNSTNHDDAVRNTNFVVTAALGVRF